MVYKLLFLIFISSCSSKYLKSDPKLDDMDTLSKDVSTPAQVPENTNHLTTEVISCYAEPKIEKKQITEKKIEQTKDVIQAIQVPWIIGEKLNYEVHAVGMNAAQVHIEVLPMKLLNGEKVWHFTSQAKTKNFASSLYYFNSKAESFVNEQLKIREYRSSAFEGDQKKIMIEKYNMSQDNYFLYKKVDEMVEINKDKNQQYIGNFVDLVSVFFYVRIAKLNEEISLLNNHKIKKLQVSSVVDEIIDVNKKRYSVEKLTLKYGDKIHTVYRNKDASRKVIKAVVDLKFATGTILLAE